MDDGTGFDVAGHDLGGIDVAGVEVTGFEVAGFEVAGFEVAGIDGSGIDGQTGRRSPLARMATIRPRGHGVVPADVVSFTARCPGCGRDRRWTQERRDTRVRSRIDCDCQG